MSKETPGSRTSEFKLAAGSIVGSFIAAVASVLAGHPRLALVLAGLAALLAGAYAFLRTWLKKERAGAVDWLSERQEATLEKALHAVGTLSDVLKLVVGDGDGGGGAGPGAEGPADDAG